MSYGPGIRRIHLSEETLIRLYCLARKTKGYMREAGELEARLKDRDRSWRQAQKERAADIEEAGFR